MSLRDEGFRFVLIDGRFSWRHPSLLANVEYVDCTDMDDKDFMDLVARVERERFDRDEP